MNNQPKEKEPRVRVASKVIKERPHEYKRCVLCGAYNQAERTSCRRCKETEMRQIDVLDTIDIRPHVLHGSVK